MIFKLVSDRATPQQWAKWLRAPLEHAAGTGNHDLVDKQLKVGANGKAGWRGCHGMTLLHAAVEGGDVDVITTMRRAGAGRHQREVPRHWAYTAGPCHYRREGGCCKGADHGRGGCERPRRQE
ncbi:unnamed protein product [Ectocarpus sp. 12 AP-2014]